jgi:hypothetical protein
VKHVLIIGGSRYATKQAHCDFVEKTVLEEYVPRNGIPSEVWHGAQTGIDSHASFIARMLARPCIAWPPKSGSSADLAARTRRMVGQARAHLVGACVFPALGAGLSPGSALLYSLMTEIVGDEEHRLVRRFIEI